MRKDLSTFSEVRKRAFIHCSLWTAVTAITALISLCFGFYSQSKEIQAKDPGPEVNTQSKKKKLLRREFVCHSN